MRKTLIFLATLVLATTSVTWTQYYMGVPIAKGYHLGYAVFAFVPALLLCLCLVLLYIQRKWTRWIGGLLLLPALGLWAISVSLILSDFKIH